MISLAAVLVDSVQKRLKSVSNSKFIIFHILFCAYIVNITIILYLTLLATVWAYMASLNI